jgi:hypothetical protein
MDGKNFAECPDCGTLVNLGLVGQANLEKRHRGTKVCLEAKSKRDKLGSKKKDMSLLTFMRKKSALVPPTVSAPSLVHGASASATITSAASGFEPLTQQPLSTPPSRGDRNEHIDIDALGDKAIDVDAPRYETASVNTIRNETIDTDMPRNEPTDVNVPRSNPDEITKPRIDPIDVDTPEEIMQTCQGFLVKFPPGRTPHSTYPFLLHEEINLPWSYHVADHAMTLRAPTCSNELIVKGKSCLHCANLPLNGILKGILERIQSGVHENAKLPYHTFGGIREIIARKDRQINELRLKRLNDNRKLLGQAGSLGDHKRFILAIGSGKFERVDRLVRIGLERNRGIRGLLKLYDEAARHVYHPKSYSEEDDLRGILLWRLGGNRVAEIAHRCLGLAGTTTLRKHSNLSPIIPSHQAPTTAEIEGNIVACFESMQEVVKSTRVVHQILMFDEIATEKRIRWDNQTNFFLGICREHGRETGLEFGSEADLEELFTSLDENRVHKATEVSFVLSKLAQCSRPLPAGHCWCSWSSQPRCSHLQRSASPCLWHLQT